jgi:hypothetical protein
MEGVRKIVPLLITTPPLKKFVSIPQVAPYFANAPVLGSYSPMSRSVPGIKYTF